MNQVQEDLLSGDLSSCDVFNAFVPCFILLHVLKMGLIVAVYAGNCTYFLGEDEYSFVWLNFSEINLCIQMAS